MKKLATILLGTCLCIALAGCNGGELVQIDPGSDNERVSGDDDDDDNNDDDDTKTVSFRDDVHPSFQPEECTYCHGGPDPYAGLSLDLDCETVYAELTIEERHETSFGTGPRITPDDIGQAEQSFFVFFAEETIPPSPQTLQLYIDWIDQGFRNDCADGA